MTGDVWADDDWGEWLDFLHELSRKHYRPIEDVDLLARFPESGAEIAPPIR